MQELPLVSVIIPAFNARLHIGAALSSVLDQDYPNLEIIVVDDGSSDETSKEALRYGERVRVIRQANAGPAAARNRGVSASRGELLAFIDADDVWIAGKLVAQVRYLREHPDVGVVFGAWIRWNASEDGTFGEPPRPSDYDEALTQLEVVRLIASAAGAIGMVGGQAIDLASVTPDPQGRLPPALDVKTITRH